MLKILINSYTCCPNMGSEPGMGWNWIVNLARYCEVYVISEGEFRPKIEEFLERELRNLETKELRNVLPNAPERFAERMHFYWNPVIPEVRKMCWNQGDWRFYKYYREWQKKTAEIARKIINEVQEVPSSRVPSSKVQGSRIDVLHQLNMIGFREPGYLWQVSKETGIPFVWGPVDAKESFPMAYANDADLKTKLKMHLKNTITKYQLKYSGRVHNAAKQGIVISASSNSQHSFKKFLGIDSPLINETGCRISQDAVVVSTKQTVSSNSSSPFNILWVGKLDFRKQLRLALMAVAEMNRIDMVLNVVGGGDDEKYKLLAEELGITERVVWHGAISHDKVQELMQASDIMLFTSVAEGTPHVVLESITNFLPVICFDTCGQGDCIDETVGRKIPLTTPSQSVHDFAEQLRYFYDNREELIKRKAGCYTKSIELSWDNKAKQMLQIYEKILKCSS